MLLLLPLLRPLFEVGAEGVPGEQVGLSAISSEMANSFNAVRMERVRGAGPIRPPLLLLGLPVLLLPLLIPPAFVSDETVDKD